METICDLMNAECVVPEWLHDVFLGYGSPEAANYKELPNCVTHLDFNDTFLSFDHLARSFPQYELEVVNCLGWTSSALYMYSYM